MIFLIPMNLMLWNIIKITRITKITVQTFSFHGGNERAGGGFMFVGFMGGY
jgi:hypothetical protein